MNAKDLPEKDWQPQLTDELRAELDRRLAAAAKNPSNVFTWEQVVQRAKSKQGRKRPRGL